MSAVATVGLILSSCGVALADIFENCLVVPLKKRLLHLIVKIQLCMII